MSELDIVLQKASDIGLLFGSGAIFGAIISAVGITFMWLFYQITSWWIEDHKKKREDKPNV